MPIIWTDADVPQYRVAIDFSLLGRRVYDFFKLETAKEVAKEHGKNHKTSYRKLTKKEIAREVARKNAEYAAKQ